MLSRMLRNVVRVPARSLRTLAHAFSPAYRLQFQANWAVPRWLPRERYEKLLSIPGTSSAREARLLAYLASQAPAGGCFVEIGAYKGKSAAWLVEAAERRSDRPTVVTIDPHMTGTWDDFQRTVADWRLVERGLEIHRSKSHDVGQTWNRPISFLWIDGSHEYEDVLLDIDDFLPHVLPGGWIVFDDACGGHFPGVERAIAERLPRLRGYRHIGIIKRFDLYRRSAA